MPKATQYPADDPHRVDKLARDEHRKRKQILEAAWKYYKGDHKKPLKVKEGQPDDNIILNLSKKLVKSGVAMLIGPDLKFELMSGDVADAQYLAGAWNANRRNILLQDVAINGYVTGHAVVKTLPARREGDFPRVVNINPKALVVFWRPDDIERVVWYSLYWTDDMRQDIVRVTSDAGITTHWLIYDYEKTGGRWELTEEPERWPFTWAPVLEWKNLPRPNEYYGESDLENADLNDAVNFVASNTARIIKAHAHPKTIGQGMEADDVQTTSIEGFLTVPNTEAEIYNLEMQSELTSSRAFLEMLRGAFFSLSNGVDLASFKDKIGQITNFGLRVLYKDALDQLETKHALYGEAFSEINRRLLELGNRGPDHEVKNHWPEPLPEDRGEETDAVTRQIDEGLISRRTGTEELGHDWETERERMEAESGESITEE